MGSFILGVIIFNYVILPHLVGRGDIVIVPELVGVNVKVAEEVCRERGLKLLIIARCNSDEMPADYVVEQNPGPDEKLKGGRSIKVVVSSGQKMVIVPDIRSMSLREATLSLKSSGLEKGRVVRIYSHTDGESCIISSSPPIGMEVPYGSTIDLLLSMRGEPSVYMMPELVGRDLLFVREKISEAGFKVARVTTSLNRDCFPNTILSQNPPAGALLREGDAIELVVSAVE
jgi:beta-lactam-binding protein with PASTA domain